MCYCGAIYQFQDYPYINKSVRLKDWKLDKAIAIKVKEKIISVLDQIKLKIKKIRKQALDKKEAIQTLDRG